jgi:hypothetical protein
MCINWYRVVRNILLPFFLLIVALGFLCLTSFVSGVFNDNNLGCSSGRRIGKNDDNEFILLEVGNFIKN